MNKDINILLIDDHPLILEFYEIALDRISTNEPELNFKIQKASDCDSAFTTVCQAYGRAAGEHMLVKYMCNNQNQGLICPDFKTIYN